MCYEIRVRAMVLGLAVVLGGAACSAPSNSPQVAYKEAETGRSLDMPPELTRDRSRTDGSIPDLDADRQRIAPEFDNIELVRAGSSSWLEFRGASAEDVWPELEAFLRAQGLGAQVHRPSAGVIETDWSRRYETPPRSGIAGILDGVFGRGDTGIHDRYQFRVERMRDGSGTRVFISHWTAEDTRLEASGRGGHGGFSWQQGSGDPAVVAEMQRRLLTYVGMRQERAERLVASGDITRFEPGDAEYEESNDVASVALLIEDADEAAGRVSESLGRLGAVIESVDEERGLYRFQWVGPDATRGGSTGLLNMFRGGDGPEASEFVLQLRPRAGETRIVTALAEDGLDADADGFSGVPASGVSEKALLQRLADALNGTIIEGPVYAADGEASRPASGSGGSDSGSGVGKRGY